MTSLCDDSLGDDVTSSSRDFLSNDVWQDWYQRFSVWKIKFQNFQFFNKFVENFSENGLDFIEISLYFSKIYKNNVFYLFDRLGAKITFKDLF